MFFKKGFSDGYINMVVIVQLELRFLNFFNAGYGKKILTICALKTQNTPSTFTAQQLHTSNSSYRDGWIVETAAVLKGRRLLWLDHGLESRTQLYWFNSSKSPEM